MAEQLLVQVTGGRLLVQVTVETDWDHCSSLHPSHENMENVDRQTDGEID